MIKFAIDIKITTNNAIPNPEISNELPIILSVNNNVIAFITNKNKPNDKIVIGSVNRINNGRTKIFRIDSIKLAITAVPKLET